MNAELNEIKSAIGNIPKAQKQDKSQQACADMCAEDIIVKLRKEASKNSGKSEAEVANELTNLMIFQESTVAKFMGAHNHIMSEYCAAFSSPEITIPDMKKVMVLMEWSFIIQLLRVVEKQESKLKGESMAGNLLRILRTNTQFATRHLGGKGVKSKGR